MKEIDLYEIHGFSSPGEYERFLQYLSKQISNGPLIEIDADPDYHAGEIYGGRWFKVAATKEIWRLVPPDFPFKGLWEPVKHNPKR